MMNKISIDWVPTLFLCLTPPAAVGSVVWYFWHWDWNLWLGVLFVLLYSLSALSITAGYHRLFAHKAYQAPTWVRWMYAFFGAGAFQNSILKWARDHRIHHRYVDQDRDPYSIKKGFWFAHIGWMILKSPPDPDANRYERDLLTDSVVVLQDRYYLPLAITSGFILPAALGEILAGQWFGGLAFGGLLRLVALHHATFFINSLCHTWGRQPYSQDHSAKDSLLAAVLTFGEGYHNYHHSFANDYRNGIKWYHWDPTKWVIQLKKQVGAASHLRVTPDGEWMKAKMRLEEVRLRDRLQADKWLAFEKTLDLMKLQIEMASERIQTLKLDIERLKRQSIARSSEKMREARGQLREKSRELNASWRAWQLLVASMQNWPTRV